MALRRLSYGVFPVALILAAAATVLAVKRTSSTERVTDSDVSQRDPLREIESVNPNEGGEVPPELMTTVAGADPTPGCTGVGAFVDQFAFGSVYRGNAVRFDRPVQLRQFTMELAMTSGPFNLYFSLHRRDPTDGLFRRFLPNDIVIRATGSGNGPNDPTTYFSTELFPTPLQLPPGEYAFGVSWGATQDPIRFGQAHVFDSEFIPGVGVMLGTVNRNVAPPIDPDNQGISLSYNTAFGLYSMEICLVPEPGACCSAALDGCTEVLETECDGPGDYFAGQFTTCDDVICRFGACCTECQACLEDFTSQACAELAGTWNYRTDCPADPKSLCPGVTGACCNGIECRDVCEAECQNVNDIFLGVGTVCGTNTCDGACWLCHLGRCRQRSLATCMSLGGEYRGPDTYCVNPPLDEQCGGACCVYLDEEPPAACINMDSREACIQAGLEGDVSIYLGDGKIGAGFTCDQAECPAVATDRRACCLPEGECIDVDFSGGVLSATTICEAMDGEINTSFNCSQLDCSAQRVTCCFPDGACGLLTNTGCSESGGTPRVTNFCAPDNPCETYLPLFGACCGTDAADCTPTTELVCEETNGVFRGIGTNCSDAAATCPGFGACCRANGECFDAIGADVCLTTYDGVYQGDGSSCSELACGDFRACCTVGGECVLATEGECGEIDGVFHAEMPNCAPDTCPAGACCIADGSCLRRRENRCTGEDIYLGDNTVCLTGVCARGACCRADGNCDPDPTIRRECNGTDDVFTSNVTCEELDPPCSPIGACCFVSGVCVELRPEECSAEGGTYQGAGLDCTPGLCNLGACCSPDHKCEDDQFLTSCTDKGEGYTFHLGVRDCFSERPCDPVGACCLFELCTVETQFQCEEIDGGAYQGDGTDCGVDACPIGACCRPAGGGFFVCDDDEFESECQGDEEAFKPGADCAAERPCDPTGACCTDTGCEIRPQLLCEPDGTYLGDGTICECKVCDSDRIVASLPVDCGTDAGYPHEPLDVNAPLGLTTIELTLNCEPSPLAPADIAVRIGPDDPPGPPAPSVTDLEVVGPATIAVTFDAPLPLRHWLCVALTGSATEVCVGALPGDVIGDRVTGLDDVTALVDDLTGARILPLHKCDIDRDGQCLFTDLLGLVDLLTGASDFQVWQDASMLECPTAVMP